MQASERTLVLALDVVEDDDGSFVGQVREWPGCLASGHTFDEMVANVRATVAEYALALDLVPFRHPTVEVSPESMTNDRMRVVVRDDALQQA